MMIKLIAMGIALAVAPAHADQSKHEKKFCAALGDFHTDMKALQSLSGDSTLQQLREASNKVSDDAYQIRKQAGKIHTPTSKELKKSVKALRAKAYSLPSDMTIAQAETQMRDSASQVRLNARKLAEESGCPDAFPNDMLMEQGNAPVENF